METSIICRRSATFIVFVLTFVLTGFVAAAPDLSVESVNVYSTDKTYRPGDEIVFHTRVKNMGDQSSYSYIVYYYASADTNISFNDYFLGYLDFNGLAPGEQHENDIATYFPSDIPDDNYYIGIAIVCLDDDNFFNNYGYDPSTVRVESPKTDLYVYVIDFDEGANGNYLPGDSLPLWIRVRNGSNVRSSDYRIDVYASEDTDITTDDYLLGYEDCDGLEPYEEYTRAGGRWNLPRDMPYGYYYIGMIITCSNDGNLENNVDYDDSAVWIGPPPDLWVESVSTSTGVYQPGDTIIIETAVRNIEYWGEGQTSESYTVKFYLSTDTIIKDDEDYLLGHKNYDGLRAGYERNDDYIALKLPLNIQLGNYYIGIIIFCNSDSNLANNTGYYPSFIQIGIPTDLFVQSIDVKQGTYQPKQIIEVDIHIKNIGQQDSNDYTVDVYASTDTDIDITDYHLANATRDGVEVDRNDIFLIECEFPPNIPEGDYFIGIITYCSGDSNQGNNAGYDMQTIKITHLPSYVYGQMKYPDKEDVNHPIRYALVEIHDVGENTEDPNDDRLIGNTHTDYNGQYGCQIRNDDFNNRNIYVKVSTVGVEGAYPGTTSSICKITGDIIFGQHDVYPDVNEIEIIKPDDCIPYYGQSKAVSHPKSSSRPVSVLISQSDAEEDTAGAFNVYDSIVEAFIQAKEFLGIELKDIIVEWPSSDNETQHVTNSWTWQTSDEIFYEDEWLQFKQEDRWDRDVVLHEYGHYIADVYNFAQGKVDDPNHYVHSEAPFFRDLRHDQVEREPDQAMNLAFSEAWANFFSIATQYNNSDYPNSGTSKYEDWDEGADVNEIEFDLETDTGTIAEDGQYYENMNHCTLWDIFDDHNDVADNNDTLSDTSLSKIWSIILESDLNTIQDFWNGWLTWDAWTEENNYEAELTRIFRDHGMNFTKP
jgi:hypothetical protein